MQLDPHAFAQSYESRDPDYTPTDAERAMIEDAICSFISTLPAVEITEAQVEAAARALCIEDGRHDPDDLDRMFCCDIDNNPLPAWQWYEDQARTALLAASLARPAEAKAVKVNRDEVIEEIAAERRRQIETEGWTPEHDDEHGRGALAWAAAAYAAGTPAMTTILTEPGREPREVTHRLWPWADEWWKPKDRRRNLVRAAALLIAEIQRIDRAASPERKHQPPVAKMWLPR